MQARRRNDGRDHFRTAKAGEFLVAFELSARGCDVTIAAEGLPYDLLAQAAGRLLRVQVKTASRPSWDGRHVFDTKLGSHKAATASRTYSVEDIDVFALVALDRRRVAFIAAVEAAERRIMKIAFDRFRRVDLTGDTLVNVIERLVLA